MIEDNLRGFYLVTNTSSNGGIFFNSNTIRNNDRDGLYAYNSVVDMFHTVFENNGLQSSSYRGIYANASSDIALGESAIGIKMKASPAATIPSRTITGPAFIKAALLWCYWVT
jgi:hypothetical protein